MDRCVSGVIADRTDNIWMAEWDSGKIAKFDTHTSTWTGISPYLDFSWRAADLGYKVRYIPTALVAHDWGTATEDTKRAYRYGVARARLYKKHPNRWRRLLGPDITALIYPVYLLGLPLTFWFWPYPLLILIPLVKNGRRQPLTVLKKHLVYAAGELRELVRL